MEVGSIVQGKVTGIAAFGAFVEMEDGKTGLVHISEIASEYVEDISQHLKKGQVVKVMVLSIDPNGKISLSIKKVQNDEPKKKRQSAPKQTSPRSNRPPEEFDFMRKKDGGAMSFEDKLLKFKQDSDEKIQDLKRNTEGKRSGGYRRAY